jgi:hypothetical protein
MGALDNESPHSNLPLPYAMPTILLDQFPRRSTEVTNGISPEVERGLPIVRAHPFLHTFKLLMHE